MGIYAAETQGSNTYYQTTQGIYRVRLYIHKLNYPVSQLCSSQPMSLGTSLTKFELKKNPHCLRTTDASKQHFVNANHHERKLIWVDAGPNAGRKNPFFRESRIFLPRSPSVCLESKLKWKLRREPPHHEFVVHQFHDYGYLHSRGF